MYRSLTLIYKILDVVLFIRLSYLVIFSRRWKDVHCNGRLYRHATESVTVPANSICLLSMCKDCFSKGLSGLNLQERHRGIENFD